MKIILIPATKGDIDRTPLFSIFFMRFTDYWCASGSVVHYDSFDYGLLVVVIEQVKVLFYSIR
jgi:hypothetical protein